MESATKDPLTIIPYEFPNVRKKNIKFFFFFWKSALIVLSIAKTKQIYTLQAIWFYEWIILINFIN